MDRDEVVTFDSMERTILGHLAANVRDYKLFHTGDVLKDSERYFKFGRYCDSTWCNCCHSRSCEVEPHNISKGLKGNIQILEHTTHATGKEVHLKFTCDHSNVANNHYEAILLLNKPTERNTEEEVTIESPCPNTFEQRISLNDAHNVIDLTDDSEMTTNQLPDSPLAYLLIQ